MVLRESPDPYWKATRYTCLRGWRGWANAAALRG